VPQERPFDLGEGADRVAQNDPQYPPRQSAEMTRLASEALARHPIDPRYVDISPDTEPPRDRGPWAPVMPSPVSAYAPVHHDAALSGRGLY
jgi:hypothetical protein